MLIVTTMRAMRAYAGRKMLGSLSKIVYILPNLALIHRIDSLGVEFELPMFPSTFMLEVRVRVSVDAISHNFFAI
jgi:hypothetical protein